MEDQLFDLIEYIGQNMPELRTVDEDYGQLEMLDDNRDSYPLIFPAVLIDVPGTEWDNIGGLNQKGLCTVTVRLCIDCYDDTHFHSGQTYKIKERAAQRKELHRLLQGHCVGDDSALIRTSSRFWTGNHGIKVYESTYTLEVTEMCEPEPAHYKSTVKISPRPGIG